LSLFQVIAVDVGNLQLPAVAWTETAQATADRLPGIAALAGPGGRLPPLGTLSGGCPSTVASLYPAAGTVSTSVRSRVALLVCGGRIDSGGAIGYTLTYFSRAHRTAGRIACLSARRPKGTAAWTASRTVLSQGSLL
jgi:hypothetical protein